MSHTVTKPFKSLNRKFAVGDKITADDIDPNGAFTLDDWTARGFAALISEPSAIQKTTSVRSSRFSAAPDPDTAAE